MHQTSPFEMAMPTPRGGSDAYDIPVNVELIIGENGAAYLTYDRPFNKPLSWFEYDLDKSSLEFVMEDGEQRNFGIPVSRETGKYLQNTQMITFIHVNDDRIEDTTDLPLIVHRH